MIAARGRRDHAASGRSGIQPPRMGGGAREANSGGTGGERGLTAAAFVALATLLRMKVKRVESWRTALESTATNRFRATVSAVVAEARKTTRLRTNRLSFTS